MSIIKLPTEIHGFDLIACGGLPEGRATLVAGSSGSAKTVFAAQFLAGFLQRSLAAPHERDARALLQQTPRHDEANAARSAGDQGVALGAGRGHAPTCSA